MGVRQSYNKEGTEKNKEGANRERFDPESVELPFQSEKFIWAWATWVKLRKKIGCPLTRIATSQQLSKLRAMVEARAIAAIEHSIRWGKVIKREALRDPKIGRTRERIEFGDIKEIKFSKLDP